MPGRLTTGRSFYRYYPPQEYGAFFQNWSIAQDHRGIIYVGNNFGVLEYDGAKWRLIPNTEGSLVSCLFNGPDGRIYVGAVRDMGYLDHDIYGKTHYVSLLDKIDKNDRNFTAVRSITACESSIYFQTQDRLFRLRADNVKTWRFKDGIGIVFSDGKKVFMDNFKTGIQQLVDDQFKLITPRNEITGDFFNTIKLPTGKDKAPLWVIPSFTRGLYFWDEKNISPFPTEADHLLINGGVHGVILLSDGTIGLCTTNHGFLRITRSGKLLSREANAMGVTNEGFGFPILDRQGSVWMAAIIGLYRVEIPSNLSRFDERHGLSGGVLEMHRHAGKTYVCTLNGVFLLEQGRDGMPLLSGLLGENKTKSSFCSIGDRLLTSDVLGVYEIRDKHVKMIKKSHYTLALHQSRKDPKRVYFGTINGLGSLRENGEQWVDEGLLVELSGIPRTIVETGDGSLWVGTESEGLFHVTARKGEKSNTWEIQNFGIQEGLPSRLFNNIHDLKCGLKVSTKKGIYHFRPDLKRFEPDPAFATLFKEPRWVYGLKEDRQGRIWMHSSIETRNLNETGAAVPKGDGTYRWEGNACLRFSGNWVESILPEDDAIWFCGPDGLVRLDTTVPSHPNQSFPVLLRSVTAGQDLALPVNAGKDKIKLRYAENKITFEFAYPSFDQESANRYRVWLEGYDTRWSEWKKETRMDYMNLHDGAYTFRVQAKNLYGVLSHEAVYPFTVLQPLYRTWWAWLGYLTAFAAVIRGAIYWRMKKLKHERDELEFNVKKRTEELKHTNEELAQINQIIKLFNQKYGANELLGTILEQASIVQGIQKSAVLVLEYPAGVFRVRETRGWPEKALQDLELTPEECHERYTINSGEVAPDLFLVRQLEHRSGHKKIGSARAPKAMLVMRIQTEGETGGYLLFENMENENAFNPQDYQLLNALKEHFISAFLKARAILHLEEALKETCMARESADDARETAERATKAKSEFLANMSHEIRTPLNGILGMINLLLGTEMTEIQRHYARSARLSGEILLSLISDILDLSKVESGRLELENVPFDLGRVLDEIFFVMEPRAEQKGLNFVCSAEPTVPHRLQGDPFRLRQVIMNLVGNAFKFTVSGEIRVNASLLAMGDGSAQIRFSVRDTGIGIPPDKQQTVFQNFTQVDASTTRKYGGTGLGLAICRQLIELMGGEIGVNSQEGKGSEFWFTLSMDIYSGDFELPQVDYITALRQQSEGLTRNYGGARILLVEDNAINRDVSMGILRKWNLNIKSACNGFEAVQTMQNEHFRLVLMDVQMPRMDGMEATKIIRNPSSGVTDCHIPIIAMTAHAMQEDRRQCLEVGMNDYITKPVEPAALARVLDRFLTFESPDANTREGRVEDPGIVFDKEGFNRRIMNDKNTAMLVINIFRNEMGKYLADLSKASKARDAQALVHELHALKGTAATLGGRALRAKVEALESAVRSRTLNDIDQELPGLQDEMQRLKRALENWE